MVKIFVGMSGGVDSSVSAALLQKAGHDVTGVFIKVWQPDWISCNWKEERLEAMRAAAYIGIPFVTLDLEKEYKQGVIDYMLEEYKVGRTPNPDVMCNREVKFGAFWKWAKEQGASYIATGHYAINSKFDPPTGGLNSKQIRELGTEKYARKAQSTPLPEGEPSDSSVRDEEGFAQATSRSCRRRLKGGVTQVSASGDTYLLCKGVDSNKDQSYFLWTLNQSDLAHILFPVGHLQKSEVRKLAGEFKLPNAEKKDSQGLCFIGKINLKEFLAHYIKCEQGNVLNENGEIIGNHPGSLFFTLGERHGFTITKKTPSDAPYFVVAKNTQANTITVSNNKLSQSGDTVKLSKCNWIREVPKVGQVISVRTRYRQELVNAEVVEINEDFATLKIGKPIDPITPGQSLVAYDGEECLGGGVIE